MTITNRFFLKGGKSLTKFKMQSFLIGFQRSKSIDIKTQCSQCPYGRKVNLEKILNLITNRYLLSKMKLFQTIQKNLSFLGISSVQSIEKNPFNTKVLIVYFNYAISMIFYFAYLNEPHDFQEYNEIIYRVSVSIVLTIHLTIIIFQMEKLFQLIVNAQQVIEES